jgi:hypothetical protein
MIVIIAIEITALTLLRTTLCYEEIKIGPQLKPILEGSLTENEHKD